MQHAVERLEAAIVKRRGSAEEITALFVALLRSHGLAVRLVRCGAELLVQSAPAAWWPCFSSELLPACRTWSVCRSTSWGVHPLFLIKICLNEPLFL